MGCKMSSSKRAKLGEQYMAPTENYPDFPRPDAGNWKRLFFIKTKAIA
jgi:hypothetical protein